MSVDTMNGVLNVAWVSASWPGPLKTRTHAAPLAYLGNSANGWLPKLTIEAGNHAYACGLAYLPNARLYLNYNLEGENKARVNDTMDTGVLADWSDPASADADHISAAGRGQMQTWRLLAGAQSSAGGIAFSQCADNRGDNWSAPVAAIGATAQGPTCGGCWLGNQYGLLYTVFTGGKVRFLLAPNPVSWPAGPGIDTTFTGAVCGLAQHPSGRLVGLVQNLGTGAVRAIWSNDKGAVWQQSAALGITPTIPPQIVCIGDVFLAVYMSGDDPRFLASLDGGETWI
jgi:hypothetical protein